MYRNNTYQKPEQNRRGKLKTNKIPNQFLATDKKIKRKPRWIKVKAPINNDVLNLKKLCRRIVIQVNFWVSHLLYIIFS